MGETHQQVTGEGTLDEWLSVLVFQDQPGDGQPPIRSGGAWQTKATCKLVSTVQRQ